MNQYEQGERFIDAVEARRRPRAARPGVGRAREPADLAEIRDPGPWIDRVDTAPAATL